MHQNLEKSGLDPEEATGPRLGAVSVCRNRDIRAPHADAGRRARPVVVVGRNGRIADDVIQETCRADDVRVLRRFSGGGAVVLAPGCLNYAVVLSLVSWPALVNVAESFQVILGRIVAALGIPGAVGRRGDRSRARRTEGVGKRAAARAARVDAPRHAAVRVRSRACDPIPEGTCAPAGLPRGPAARGVHRQPPALCRDDPGTAGGSLERFPA